MSTETTNPTVVGPAKSARSWSDPRVRFGLMGVFGLIGLLVIWRILSPAQEVKVKGKAEAEIEKIMDKSKKDGTATASTTTATGKQSDQPIGDAEAVTALNTVDAKDKLDARRKADAEDKMLANLAYQHYIRRTQGLKYEPALAAEWERRVQEAQAKGQAPPSPGEMTAENLEEIRKSQPELYAKWMAMRGEKGAPNPGSSPTAVAKGGAPTTGQGTQAPQGVVMANGLPAGIDPKTGLPNGAAVGGVPGDVIYALQDDGSPDLARGAIPVTVQFDIPGSKEKTTKTIWIRPGYLSGRVRPVDPMELKAVEEEYRRALKDPTDVPAEAAHNVAIPYRYTNAKTRVAPSADFNFENRYVVVLPNPNGKLTPPNPPQPKTTGGEKK